MFYKRILLPTLIITLTLACSRLPSSEEEPYPVNGEWESSCVDVTEFDYVSQSVGTISRQTLLEFTNSDVTRTVYEYNKGSCLPDNLRLSKTFIGQFTLNTEQLDAEEQVIDIDISYQSLVLTAHTEQMKNTLESEFNKYDLTFNLDKDIDVTNTTHGEIMRYYDIFEVENGKLMFGDKSELDGLSSQSRPDIINTSSDTSFYKL